jgi:hypothetical protein
MGGRNGCIDPYSLDLRINLRSIVSFTLRLLYPRKRAPSETHWMGDWMRVRAGVDDVERMIVETNDTGTVIPTPAAIPTLTVAPKFNVLTSWL